MTRGEHLPGGRGRQVRQKESSPLNPGNERGDDLRTTVQRGGVGGDKTRKYNTELKKSSSHVPQAREPKTRQLCFSSGEWRYQRPQKERQIFPSGGTGIAAQQRTEAANQSHGWRDCWGGGDHPTASACKKQQQKLTDEGGGNG